MAEPCSLTARHARIALGLVCLGCSGGDYWLGGRRPTESGGPPLVDDWLVTGPDPVEIGPDSAPCRIVGNGFGIRTEGTFSGDLWIHDCEFIGLGSTSKPAIDVLVSDPGSVRIERCVFRQSGAVEIGNDDATPTTFRDNLIEADATIPLDPSQGFASNVFEAQGESQAPKLFQGNRVYRGRVRLASPNWLIGGDTDADGNVMIGLRAGLALAATGLVVRGNFVHPEHLAGAGDESCIDTDYSVTDALAEHNVLRRGTWVVRGFGGEFRDNALFDPDNLAFVQQPFENTRIHHNLFAMCTPAGGDSPLQGGIELVNARASGIEIFNNTFEGGGASVGFGGPAVSIEGDSLLASLRSNLIQHFYFSENLESAAVRPGAGEGGEPPPERLGYADYNLFDNDGETPPHNYTVTVPGLGVRLDPGFGLNDALPGGEVDQQVLAELAGAAECLPFSDDDVRAGRTSVSSILAALRAAYTPLATSPALGGGDPQDGAGNFIGAVGDGTLTDDRFGRFGP